MPTTNTHLSSSVSEHSQQVIDEYISHCKSSLTESSRLNNRKDNLTNKERQILNSLKKRTDIVIKKADKGDTIVVETKENYIKDGLTHLSNEKYYKRLAEDLNPDINHAITNFLNNAHQRGLLDKETFLYLLPSTNCRTPIIYFLKKLHKSPTAVRPIVSHINSPTCNISSFIDTLLKPIVKAIPHILSNSRELITDLSTIPNPNQCTLVSLDVTSLYPNIPIEESINIILNYLSDENNPTYPPICIINHLLRFVLYYNCFNFADLFFLQVHGIAMGTKLAPNYANLFMADFENKYVFNYPVQPTLYRRYIDDIFFVWNHDLSELDQFIDHLNAVHPTIKFTKTVSSTEITYLDLDIYIKDNSIHTKTHFKPTNTFSYLHGRSNHPHSTFKGVKRGENIRILRNTSEEATYESTMQFINNHFKKRKYPTHLTNQTPISFSERPNYLQSNTDKTSDGRVTFCTTFDPSLSIIDHLAEDWPRLSSDSNLRNIFHHPPQISYRHSPNLSQLLVRAKLDATINTNIPLSSKPAISTPRFPAKNISCRNNQCGTCEQLSGRSHYYSYQTKCYYSIPDIFSCDTTNAIYLLDCTICGKQYVGETHTTVRNRMKHHRNMSKSATNRPIYAHLANHHTDFKAFNITIIDREEDLIQRKAKEKDYILLLKTKFPFGLNVIK